MDFENFFTRNFKIDCKCCQIQEPFEKIFFKYGWLGGKIMSEDIVESMDLSENQKERSITSWKFKRKDCCDPLLIAIILQSVLVLKILVWASPFIDKCVIHFMC